MQSSAEIGQNEWGGDNLLRLAISSNSVYEFHGILGSTVNLLDSFRSTLLRYRLCFKASENHSLAWYPNVVRFLLQYGATVNIKDPKGNRVSHLTC
jgi:hypothetical protein